MKRIYFFITMIVLTSPLYALQDETVQNASFKFKIKPGSNLKITVYNEPDLSLETKVTEEEITFPFLGRVKVVGLSNHELEDLLTKKLSDGYIKKPQVFVTISDYSGFYIYGEVTQPGEHRMGGAMTILEAIALAGGFTKVASSNGTRVIRYKEGKKEMHRVKVGDMLKSDEPLFQIEPGDIITVPESFF